MKIFHRIILLMLLLLVLVSSTGISVGMHLCAGEIRELDFYGQADDCPVEQKKEALPPCHTPREESMGKSCCENHQLTVQHLDVAVESKALLLEKLQDVKFLAVIKAVVLQFYAPEAAQNPQFTNYSSPPLARDIPVLVQSFLL